MAHYVSTATQTDIQGLCHDPSTRPTALLPPAATPTPPDDMAIDKSRLSRLPTHESPPSEQATPPPYRSHGDDANTIQPSVMLKRKDRPAIVARISLPSLSDLNAENPRSPPPTEALMSPLPLANRLYAGHTPIIPRSLSPLPPSESGPSTPDVDAVDEGALSGPLTLPPQPGGEGAVDTIPLSVLDQELEKLRIAQENSHDREGSTSISDSMTDPPEPPRFENENENENANVDADAAPLSRKTSNNNDRKLSTEETVVDGVLLKKPKMNLGAPLGQA